jgi:hypothetical protein
VSGFCGLSYQVIWQALFANLMGSGALASTLVISFFLGGLAVGYEIGARQARSMGGAMLLVWATCYEGAVGVWSLLLASLVLALPGLIAPLAALGDSHFFDTLVAATLIVFPTICMGAVFPLLVEVLARVSPSGGRYHAILYGCNTLGAIVGCLATGLLIVPSVGMRASLYFFALLSLGVAWALAKGFHASGISDSSGNAAPSTKARLPFSAVTSATLAGVAVFMWQMIELRLFSLAAGPSHYLFALVVAAFILVSSLTAFAVSRLSASSERLRSFLWPVAFCAAAWLYLIILYAPTLPYLSFQLRIQFGSAVSDWYGYHSALWLMILILNVLLLAPLSMIVAVLVLNLAQTESTGFIAGRLWRWNSVGCVIGAVLGGYFGYSYFSMEELAKIAGAVSIAALTLLALQLSERLTVAAAATLLAVPLWLLPPWDALRMSIGIYYLRERDEFSEMNERLLYRSILSDAKVIAAKDDRHGRVAVVEFAGSGGEAIPERVLYIEGKPEGNTHGDSV